MLSQSTIDIVKAITPAVAANAETITRRFYQRMFIGNPEVKQYFNEAHQHSGGQQKALAGAICAYFANIDNLAALGPAVEMIAQKHCSLGIQPAHYPIVGKHLLAAIGDVMGDAVTEPVVKAVTEAYSALAVICIERERAIYQEQADQPGGWNGFRKFVVGQKVPESKEVTSFYLHPEDGKAIPPFAPGQYVTVKMTQVSGVPTFRNYSLSDVPGTGYFRISVKREFGKQAEDPRGIVSNYLHEWVDEGDYLEVGPPCGEFTLNAPPSDDRPIVFIAGGIGVTPLLSMAKQMVHSGSKTPVTFLQAARNSEVRAFGAEIDSLKQLNPNVSSFVLFSEPLADDITSGRCDVAGIITRDVLMAKTPYREADFYFCGPANFMKSTFTLLKGLDVPKERIHFEFFGPRQEIA